MKKIVAFFVATLLFILSIFTVSANVSGDTDNDGFVAITDATRIQMHIAKKITLDDEALSAADVDGDGTINIIDCTFIQQHVAKLISEFPCDKKDSPQPSQQPSLELSTDSGLSQGDSIPTQPDTQPETEPTESKPGGSTPVEENGPSQYDLEILELVNIEREKAGLEPLEFGYFIYDCAKLRAEEADLFFSHTRPDNTPWYTVFDEFGKTDYHLVGENLAWGHSDAYDVMLSDYGWMNSPGHRANILDERFQYVAIASVECTDQPGTYCTVQLFWKD